MMGRMRFDDTCGWWFVDEDDSYRTAPLFDGDEVIVILFGLWISTRMVRAHASWHFATPGIAPRDGLHVEVR